MFTGIRPPFFYGLNCFILCFRFECDPSQALPPIAFHGNINKKKKKRKTGAQLQ